MTGLVQNDSCDSLHDSLVTAYQMISREPSMTGLVQKEPPSLRLVPRVKRVSVKNSCNMVTRHSLSILCHLDVIHPVTVHQCRPHPDHFSLLTLTHTNTD